MSTATTSSNQHHPFPMALTLAAASAAVLVSGLAGWGISEAQDDAAPTHSQTSTTTTPQHQMCPDERCMPQSPSQQYGYGTQFGSHEPTLNGGAPLKGGHTMMGLP
jgi:hypothetical protein